jgi:hypothetical protein
MRMRNWIVRAVGFLFGVAAVFFLLWSIQLGMLFAPTAGMDEARYVTRAETYFAIAVLLLGLAAFLLVYRKN